MDKALSRVDKKKVQNWRIRTIIYSIICSGLVALFITNIAENTIYNRGVDDLRQACEAIYRDRTALRTIAHEVSAGTDDPRVRERWNRYEETFAQRLPPNTPTCEEIYPKRDFLSFLD